MTDTTIKYLWPTQFHKWITSAYPDLNEIYKTHSIFDNPITNECYISIGVETKNINTFISNNGLNDLQQYIIDNEDMHWFWLL